MAALSLGASATMSFRPKQPRHARDRFNLGSGTSPAARPPPAPSAVLNLTLNHGVSAALARRVTSFFFLRKGGVCASGYGLFWVACEV